MWHKVPLCNEKAYISAAAMMVIVERILLSECGTNYI